MEKLVQDHLTGLWYRPESWDRQTIRAVSTYKELQINDQDIVMDVGGHLGAFTDHALKQGARRVVAFEPAPGSFELFRKNHGGKPKLEMHNAALVPHGETTAKFYLNRGMNHGLHSSVPRNGREVIEVKALNFIETFNAINPTVLKMDCEGAEYELLYDSVALTVLFHNLRALAIEYHFGRAAWKKQAELIHAHVLLAGFTAVRAPKFDGRGWATIAVYRREEA